VSASIIVCGPSGVGKSRIGGPVASRLGLPFVEGDELHPPANIAKMAGGVPLDDGDRWPWLDAVVARLEEIGPAVATCSALKRSYRDRLRAVGEVCFVLLTAPGEELGSRLAGRTGHFFDPDLLADQLATLEMPSGDETDVLVVSTVGAPDVVVERVLDRLQEHGTAAPGRPPRL